MEKHGLLKVYQTIREQRTTQTRRYAYYVCDCGRAGVTDYYKITSGAAKSCGCLAKTRFIGNKWRRTHGMTNTRTFKSWQMMKDRCTNPHNKDYRHYGGRGITFDPRWASFENFYADMGERPKARTLDRIDVNGKYNKENCRWADSITQRHNRRK